MTDTNQKLREALQAISHIDDSTNHAVDASAALDRIGKIARQALALPTADHIPEILFARDIYDGLGYAKWENFNTLIKRCKQLIAHGQHEGSIQDTERFVEIGYGARRRVIDYKLDAKAHQLVISMASAFKLVGHYPSRNETSILSFIERWCKAKNISFIAQSKEISGHVFDALVGGSVAIEFDEPHHLESRQSLRDANKDRQSNESGIHVLRIGLESNVIDVIVDIESILAGKMIEPPQQHHRDSKELRSLCQARDEARKQRDLCQAEIAGLNSAVGYLSAMVDEQTRLVQKAVQAMKALHETAKPDDGPDMNAIIPAAAFHVFVDVHAELMFALKQGPQITTLLSAAPDNNGSALGSCYPETAAPVGEREAFEREMSKPPFEFCMDRWPDDGAYAWPGNYAAYHTQCAWDAWQARAALSAGDAVDAQMYRWLMDNCTLGIKQNGVGWSLNTTACIAPDCIKDVGATIDAAMRKGQL